jgi:hypothetical protein
VAIKKKKQKREKKVSGIQARRQKLVTLVHKVWQKIRSAAAPGQAGRLQRNPVAGY